MDDQHTASWLHLAYFLMITARCTLVLEHAPCVACYRWVLHVTADDMNHYCGIDCTTCAAMLMFVCGAQHAVCWFITQVAARVS